MVLKNLTHTFNLFRTYLNHCCHNSDAHLQSKLPIASTTALVTSQDVAGQPLSWNVVVIG